MSAWFSSEEYYCVVNLIEDACQVSLAIRGVLMPTRRLMEDGASASSSRNIPLDLDIYDISIL